MAVPQPRRADPEPAAEGVARAAVPGGGLPGRAAEQEALRALLAAAGAGRGGAVLLVGEPGAGKTALLRAAAAAADRFRVLPAQGAESEAGIPLAGLHAMLRPVAGHVDRLPGPQAAALAAVLEPGGRRPADRLLLAAATLRLLTELAADAPVLCCVDDAHWLDPASLDVLAFAARRLAGEPVGMLFAARDADGDERYREALGGVPVLPVRRLDQDASRALVDAAAIAGGTGLAAGAAEAVVRLAGGNPLALLELAGALTPDQRAGRAAAPDHLPAGSVLLRAYTARLRRLPAATRTLLLLAAAEPELTVDTLLRAAAEHRTGAAALGSAERAGLVRVDRATVHFDHPLLRAAVYHGAALADRRAAHQVLARVYGRAGEDFRSAWHRAAVAEPPVGPLADELSSAAVEVRRRGGYAHSSVAFERAAQLSAPGPVRARRLLAAARDGWLAGQPHRARVLLHAAERSASSADLRGRVDLLRGDLELRTGDLPTAHGALLSAARQLLPTDRALAVQAVMRAGQAATLAGDHAGYLETARWAAGIRQPVEGPAAEFVFEHLAGISAVIQGDSAEAETRLRRVVEIAASQVDTSTLICASVAALILGDVRTARASAARAVATAKAREALSSVPQALEALVYAELAAGRYLAARPSAVEGLRLAGETGQDNCATHHLAALAVLDAVGGDEQSCLDRARTAAARATARGLGLAAAHGAWAEAMLHLGHGRPAEAAARFRASARAGVGRTHFAVRLLTTPHFVEAAACSGDRPRARAAADGYERWAQTTGDPGWLALAERCAALLSAGPAAEEHFGEALRLHALATADFERARTELLFGNALRRQRRPGVAREHLYEALDVFRSFGARHWAARTQAELRAAGEPAPPAGPAAAADLTAAAELTAQQLQIARYVADGATNREVAAQLYLSPRTVDHHLRNIYTKLGIRSRVELARLLG